MATQEEIRERIVELIKEKKFSVDELLNTIHELYHDNIISIDDLIKIIKYFVDDILDCTTRSGRTERINPRTGRKYTYPAHKWAWKKFTIAGEVELIVDKD